MVPHHEIIINFYYFSSSPLVELVINIKVSKASAVRMQSEKPIAKNAARIWELSVNYRFQFAAEKCPERVGKLYYFLIKLSIVSGT